MKLAAYVWTEYSSDPDSDEKIIHACGVRVVEEGEDGEEVATLFDKPLPISDDPESDAQQVLAAHGLALGDGRGDTGEYLESNGHRGCAAVWDLERVTASA